MLWQVCVWETKEDRLEFVQGEAGIWLHEIGVPDWQATALWLTVCHPSTLALLCLILTHAHTPTCTHMQSLSDTYWHVWPPQLRTNIQLCQAGYGLITINAFRKVLWCNPTVSDGTEWLNTNKPDPRCIHNSFESRLKSRFWKNVGSLKGQIRF